MVAICCNTLICILRHIKHYVMTTMFEEQFDFAGPAKRVRQRDSQRDRQTGQTARDRERERETDKQADRQGNRQTARILCDHLWRFVFAGLAKSMFLHTTLYVSASKRHWNRRAERVRQTETDRRTGNATFGFISDPLLTGKYMAKNGWTVFSVRQQYFQTETWGR